MLSVVLLAPLVVSVASAQDLTVNLSGIIRFGSFLDETTEISEVDLQFSNGLEYPELPNNTTTGFFALDPGNNGVTFLNAIDGSELANLDFEVEAGNTNIYSIIYTGGDTPITVINETVVAEDAGLAVDENLLTILSRSPSARFWVYSNESLTPQRVVTPYEYFAQSSIGTGGVTVEYTNPETGIVSQAVIPYFPNTDVIINGDAMANPNAPFVINYSTSSSVAQWLTNTSAMPNTPFAFSNFLNAATVGGFRGALDQCEDYMWFPFTDASFNALNASQQTYVSGAGAGVVMDNSVLQPATTAPWNLSPTTTRGGTPLTISGYIPLPEGDEDVPQGALTANIILTVSTTGNDVQNVIHVVTGAPVNENNQAPAIHFYSDIDEAMLGG
jgi:hypothetical protein